MTAPDLNLLIALNALLSEGSVSGAATRLRLSSSAMSRTLARLRKATGDPLLVRAGRALVPTPHAVALRERTRALVEDAESVLRPAAKARLDQLDRRFTIRSSDGFVENYGAALVSRITKAAPGVRLRFVQKSEKDSAPLRDGLVDLETGVVDAVTAPEFKMQTLFRDRFVGVVREGHALASGRVTARRFAECAHVAVSRRPDGPGLVDDAAAKEGITRRVVASVGGFAAAIAIVRQSDLVAVVPERHTMNLREGLATFTLPFAMEPIVVAMLWHPRLDADGAHRWIRECVRETCRGKA
jgi:DNA-binding transcriptional LysR family regulator